MLPSFGKQSDRKTDSEYRNETGDLLQARTRTTEGLTTSWKHSFPTEKRISAAISRRCKITGTAMPLGDYIFLGFPGGGTWE